MQIEPYTRTKAPEERPHKVKTLNEETTTLGHFTLANKIPLGDNSPPTTPPHTPNPSPSAVDTPTSE